MAQPTVDVGMLGPREIEGVGELTRFAREYIVVVAREEGGLGWGGAWGEGFRVRFGDVVVGGGLDAEFVLVLGGKGEGGRGRGLV